MTIYLSGPMTGVELWNFPAFDAAAADLRAKGYTVISPAELSRETGFDPLAALTPAVDMAETVRRDIDGVITCDAVVLLPRWERSAGAAAELAVARWLKKEVLLYPDLEALDCEDILHEAYRLTSGDRQNSYGPPDQDFQRTATMWEVLLGCPVSTVQVAMCMVAPKMSRMTHQPKRDSLVDMAGYTRCAQMCIDAERARKAQKDNHEQ